MFKDMALPHETVAMSKPTKVYSFLEPVDVFSFSQMQEGKKDQWNEFKSEFWKETSNRKRSIVVSFNNPTKPRAVWKGVWTEGVPDQTGLWACLAGLMVN